MQPHFQGGGAQNKLADRINSASQAVLTGKGDIRNALLSKEINVPSNPTFQQLSNAILNVQTKEYILVFSDDTPGSYDVTGITGYSELIELENCKIYSFTTPITLNYTAKKIGEFNDVTGQISLTQSEPKKIVNLSFKDQSPSLFRDYDTLYETEKVGTGLYSYTGGFYNIAKSKTLKKGMFIGSEREDGKYPLFYLFDYETKTTTSIPSTNVSFGSQQVVGCFDDSENKFYSISNRTQYNVSSNLLRDVVDLVTNTLTRELVPFNSIFGSEYATLYLQGSIINENDATVFCTGYVNGVDLIAVMDLKLGVCRKYINNDFGSDLKPSTQTSFRAGVCYNNKAFYTNVSTTNSIVSRKELFFDMNTLALSTYVAFNDGEMDFFYSTQSSFLFNDRWYKICTIRQCVVNSEGNYFYKNSLFKGNTSSSVYVSQFVICLDLKKGSKEYKVLNSFRTGKYDSFLDFFDLGDGYLSFPVAFVEVNHGSTHGYTISANIFKIPAYKFESFLF